MQESFCAHAERFTRVQISHVKCVNPKTKLIDERFAQASSSQFRSGVAQYLLDFSEKFPIIRFYLCFCIRASDGFLWDHGGDIGHI